MLLRLLLLAALSGGLAPALAQVSDQPTDARAAYYTYVRPGELTVTVLVMGHVRAPGTYTVGLGTTADRLLALAGGATPSSTDARDVTTTTVRVLRPDADGTRQALSTQPLDAVYARPGPALDDGDLLVVDRTTRRNAPRLDTALRVATTAGTLFLVVYNILTR